jgi:hypothetical protein
MLDLTFCPEAGCSSPAEIFHRSALQSTDGPTHHVRIRCLNRHHFLLPAERLISAHPVDVSAAHDGASWRGGQTGRIVGG